jgi:lipopolysaccharide assembly outer membrane protein LptD (OstA)
MKWLICCVSVFALAVMVSGQSQPSPKLTRIVFAPSTIISARDLQQDWSTNTLRARGQVRIEAPPSTFTADEADIHHLSDTRTAVDLDIELRGNVHVVIAASASR